MNHSFGVEPFGFEDRGFVSVPACGEADGSWCFNPLVGTDVLGSGVERPCEAGEALYINRENAA
jgi:hypothetical protein